jgi:hypothetical protein
MKAIGKKNLVGDDGLWPRIATSLKSLLRQNLKLKRELAAEIAKANGASKGSGIERYVGLVAIRIRAPRPHAVNPAPIASAAAAAATAADANADAASPTVASAATAAVTVASTAAAAVAVASTAAAMFGKL